MSIQRLLFGIAAVVVLLAVVVVGVGLTGVNTPGTGKAAGEQGGLASGSVEDLAERLRAAGASVVEGGEVNQPFFSVQGRVLRVNGQDVQVFAYQDATLAAQEAARVAPDGSSVGTTMVTWMATPHFYKAERLVVLYVGEDANTLGALRAVLGEQFAGRQPGAGVTY